MLQPPPQEYFDDDRAVAGARRFCLRIGSLDIVFEGLDEGLVNDLRSRYSIYAAKPPEDSATLRVRVGLEDRDYFIAPEPTPQPAKVRITYDSDSARVRYVSYCVAGWFESAGGTGQVLFSRGDYEPRARALENYIRVAVAWLAATRGGALVHAASAVLGGRGYLFYGESGAGKSTLSACNTRARIVSDDLSLLLPGDDGHLTLVGSPFRGTYEQGDPVVGAYPLAAGFRIIKDTLADVRSTNRLRALSEFIGNMPFVAEAFVRRPDLFAKIETALADVPLAHLHFRKDDSYWDAIAAAEL